MFGIAATSGRYERRTARGLSTWTREYLRVVALADLGCAVLGVFVAAQLRFGNNVTHTYLALSLALPVLWIAALWLSGAYDVRFIGTGSDEYRKVLNAGVSLTAAVRNLALWTGYSGVDPEVSNSNGTNVQPSQTSNGGTVNNDVRADFGAVPLPRYFVLRLNVGL